MIHIRKQWTFLGSWILYEYHEKKCYCSYCDKFTGSFGIALPKCKARNSWRIIWWRRKGTLRDVRWTLPDFERRKELKYDKQ